MVVGIIIACVIGWFAFGVLYAPKAAAFAYKHRDNYWREEAAHMWYWWSLFVGPVVVVLQFIWYAFERIYYPLTRNGDSRVKMALVKHDEEYRKKYLEHLEYKNAKLERENALLTKDVMR